MYYRNIWLTIKRENKYTIIKGQTMSKDGISTMSVGLLGILSLALSTTEKAAEQGAIGVAIGTAIFCFILFNTMLNN